MASQFKSFRVRAVDYLKKLMDSGELPTQKAAGERLGVSQQVIQKFLKTGAMGTPTIERMIELYPGAREYIYNPGHELVEAEPVPDEQPAISNKKKKYFIVNSLIYILITTINKK